MQKNRVHKMMAVAILAAMGVVLQLVSFPVIPGFNYLKIDFSDIPVMMSLFLYGPMAGVATAFIRSLVHLAMTGFSLDNLIGDGASFLATIMFTMPMFFFFKKQTNTKRNKVLGVFSGILLMTVFMSIANYFVLTPLYLKILGWPLGMALERYILVAIVPFNLVKGSIVSVVFLVLHARLLPWLTRQQKYIGETI
ncbi:riboflavin transporter FmnP [Enterococcus sp. PF1-24]|uniref:ECF transporter S component n=1 Tax=unclassified Enterococcus TaxID=2608891 RepID=UPI002476F1E8|nr:MULTISPECIES: ECF transporter S component [unclassified Enterococcus]MDH6364926.1 riboflavin transporter FmnP [Enterococcus sp. PFB1-1]MDH6402027.1 riboflavin transporter FmnP [Enterococcus sp. PF1-24]